jgi:hypothetical protein
VNPVVRDLILREIETKHVGISFENRRIAKLNIRFPKAIKEAQQRLDEYHDSLKPLEQELAEDGGP